MSPHCMSWWEFVDQGPVSLRQYKLVYSILARKQEFLVNFQACEPGLDVSL